MHNRLGRQTVALERPSVILSHAAVGGRQEGDGPLSDYFDHLCEDSFFGEKTWEKAESAMQKMALSRALEKAALTPEELDYILAGDLLNQCIGTSFGLRDFGIPFYGLYGACSTMGESLALASLLIAGGFARRAGAMTSSHFCTAERQYRMPVPYGSQRTPTAQWTATAAGCVILGAEGDGPRITTVTCGKIVDKGIADANNMGAAMAPAAYDTLSAPFAATHTGPQDYDLVLTGDLGWNKNTTYTLIKRCIKKGAVRRSEPNFMCHALIPKEEVQEAETNELINKIYDGSADKLFAALLNRKKLSAEEIERLKQLVADLE